MDRSGYQVWLGLVVRQSFASAEQNRRRQPGPFRTDEFPDESLTGIARGIHDADDRDHRPRLEHAHAFRDGTAHSCQLPISAGVFREIEFTRIERRGRPCQLPENSQADRRGARQANGR